MTKTASKLPDLMARIEELREASRDCTPEEYEALRLQREALRDQLREQRRLEHEADMQLAQAMPEVCQFGALLDPTPHRRNHVPAKRPGWLAPIAGCAGLVVVGTVLLLQWFDVLVVR